MKHLGALTRKAAIVALLIAATMAVAACVYGCAPKTAAEAGGGEESATEGGEAAAAVIQGDFEFSADADCAVCHTVEGDSLGDTACPASNHAEQACTTCHTDVDALTDVHADVAYGDTMPKRLKTTKVDEATCLTEACHGSYEALAEKTASSTLLTDSEGTVVNPHDMPENEDHETIDCGSCHDMHASDDIADTAQKACQSCHHMGIYECYTCHD